MPYKNPEDKKAWTLRNKKQKAVYDKVYRQENKEQRAATTKAWHLANKERKLANDTAWRKANPEKVAVILAKRRLLKQNAEAIMTEAEIKNYQELVIIRDNATKLFGYEWSIDHIIPLSWGGTNAIDNLEVVPLSWNKAKRDRHSESFWGTA